MSKSTTKRAWQHIQYCSESDFQATIIQMAELYRWLVYHTHDSRRSAPGFPDLTMVRRGHLIFAELKTEKGPTSAAQKRWLAELQMAHPHVYLWRPSDWSEIEAVLR